MSMPEAGQAAERDEREQQQARVFMALKMQGFCAGFCAARYRKADNTPCPVDQGLYLGSVGAALNKEALKTLNITHILIVARSPNPEFPAEFTYKKIEVLDSPDTDLVKHFGECFIFIDEGISTGGNVLVHCFAGRSQSVTVVLAYLMKKHKMSLESAMSLVRSKRPQVAPNEGFLSQLENFEKSLQDKKLQGMKLFGYGIPGQGFYSLQAPGIQMFEQQAATGVIIVKEGVANAQRIEAEMKHLIQSNWDWKVRKISDVEYAVVFPSKEALDTWSKARGVELALHSIKVKVEKSTLDPKASSILATSWVKVSGIPLPAKTEELVKEITSTIGEPLEVDEISLMRAGPVRVKVYCRDPSQVNCFVEIFINSVGYEIKFEAEVGPILQKRDSYKKSSGRKPDTKDEEEDEEEEESNDSMYTIEWDEEEDEEEESSNDSTFKIKWEEDESFSTFKIKWEKLLEKYGTDSQHVSDQKEAGGNGKSKHKSQDLSSGSENSDKGKEMIISDYEGQRDDNL